MYESTNFAVSQTVWAVVFCLSHPVESGGHVLVFCMLPGSFWVCTLLGSAAGSHGDERQQKNQGAQAAGRETRPIHSWLVSCSHRNSSGSPQLEGGTGPGVRSHALLKCGSKPSVQSWTRARKSLQSERGPAYLREVSWKASALSYFLGEENTP